MKTFRTTYIIGAFIFIFFTLGLRAQTFQGFIYEAGIDYPVEGAIIVERSSKLETISDAKGFFLLTLDGVEGSVQITISKPGYDAVVKEVFLDKSVPTDMGVLYMDSGQSASSEDLIPTVSISDADVDDDDSDDISALLTASRDVFTSAASFTFGPRRFRVRGYNSEYNAVYLNGMPMNDLERGRVSWSHWTGLNDVTRNTNALFGIQSIGFSFGDIGGASEIDTRASNMRKQIRLSTSVGNRSYRYRTMLTYNTGLLPGGWAISLSGSRRWAEEGYVPGTFYDGWSYFLSVDKKLSDAHSLNLTALGTPLKRGKNTGVVQEAYDITGTNYYNPNWGYQSGEKRNARVSNQHQPIVSLRHDWKITDKANLSTTIGYQFGRNGATALDWFNARDPRPDYYRYLPSYIDDPVISNAVATLFKDDPSVGQLDWARFYDVNRASSETIKDANGVAGNDVSGRLSKYILEDRRYDVQRIAFNTVYEHILSDTWNLKWGAQYEWYKKENFKVLEDLLGGSFYVDLDKFAERDFPNNPDFQQNDLNRPNRILNEGDRFGYDFDANIRHWNSWIQMDGAFGSVDAFASLKLSGTNFWRTGNVRNGKFPDSSFGDAEKQDFFNYAGKAGLTYKLDGRNYFYVSGLYETRAPLFRNTYVSPRTRNELVDGLGDETVYGVEGGYYIRAPYFNAKLVGYWTRFEDQTDVTSFYHDDERSFVNYALTGIDKEHRGLEIAVQAKVNTSWTVEAVAALGSYQYQSRPTATITQDNDGSTIAENRTIYADNFYESGTPQSAYTFGIEYEGKDYWSVSFNVNYLDDVFMDFNPTRRTAAAVDGVEQGSAQWNDIIFQEKTDGGFSVDFFGRKSFRFDNNMRLNINAGVSNILDNQDFVSGGYEQLRFDFEEQNVDRFPTKYFYQRGLNFLVNVSLSF